MKLKKEFTSQSCAEPVVKWVGGKRQLLTTIQQLLPQTINRYIEPFAGGAAVFCAIAPMSTSAVLNDINRVLVYVYHTIQQTPDDMIFELKKIEQQYNSITTDEKREEFYYTCRDEYNQYILEDILNIKVAALFIFLNKTTYNGIYRTNKRNLFNGPFGRKEKVTLYNSDNIHQISVLLKKTELMSGDFESPCSYATQGDFVFLDPPYHGTFDSYQAGGFTDNDNLRLKRVVNALSDKGVNVMLTNSESDFIMDLYADYNVRTVDVKRLVNSNASKRTGKEVIITNY